MIEKVRQKLLAFIYSQKDVPLLAGFSIGFYMMLFYYNKNFGMANSWQQLLFFIGYYMLLPMVSLYLGYKLVSLVARRFRKHFLFIGIVLFFSYFILQLVREEMLLIILAIGLVAVLLSIWLHRYYKLFILLFFLMSVFNVRSIAGAAYKFAIASDEWKKLPDDIEHIKFKQRPNIYYIQPDGYTSFRNLRENPYYTFDNSRHEAFLEQEGFTLYENFRSNYAITLLSNSATFSMKHHFMAKDVEFYGARAVIAKNPVLRILKRNGYKTSFITQNPYLIMNRPPTLYDYCNISYDELPYLRDGFGIEGDRDVLKDLAARMAVDGKEGNFYFVERFLPGHIHSQDADSDGREEEQQSHMEGLAKSAAWLRETVSYITANDPGALIIIGADHGGFTGFNSVHESMIKTDDKELVYSMFGAHMAIKWNRPVNGYDGGLRSNINLFRTVFAYLADDKKYLEHQEDNSSYSIMKQPAGRYKYIDDKGKVVFEKHK